MAEAARAAEEITVLLAAEKRLRMGTTRIPSELATAMADVLHAGKVDAEQVGVDYRTVEMARVILEVL